MDREPQVFIRNPRHRDLEKEKQVKKDVMAKERTTKLRVMMAKKGLYYNINPEKKSWY